VDWIDFDDTAETGWARILYSGSIASSGTQVVRIYPPVSGNASVAASGTYGSDNAYKSTLEAYYADGAQVDRTANGRDLTPAGSPTVGGATGQVGAATDYNGSSQYADTTDSTLIALPQTYDMTVLAWINPDAEESAAAAFAFEGADDLVYYPNDDQGGSGVRVFWRDLGGAGITLNENDGSDETGNWNQYGFITRASDDHETYRNAASLETATNTGSAGTFNAFRVGSFTTGAQHFDGKIQEVQVWSEALSAAWLSHEYSQTNDNATFWGTWTNVPVASGGNRRRRLILGAAA
jgi:hypothetical protein